MKRAVVEPYGIAATFHADRDTYARQMRRVGLPAAADGDYYGRAVWAIAPDRLAHLAVVVDVATLPDAASALRVACHESVHAAALVFDHIEEPVTAGEPFAYLVEWIFGQVMDVIRAADVFGEDGERLRDGRTGDGE